MAGATRSIPLPGVFAGLAAAQGFRPASWPTAVEEPVRGPDPPAGLRLGRPIVPGERSTLVSAGDGAKPQSDSLPQPDGPPQAAALPEAWQHEPDWAALVLAAPGVDPQLGLVASDLLSALALVTGRGRPLLVTTDQRLGQARWLLDATPVGHATTSGLLSHAVRHLRGACDIPDLLAIRASWSLDLYDRYGVRSVAGIRLASGNSCHTLLLMAHGDRRELSHGQISALAALDRLARATAARFDPATSAPGESQHPGVVETLTASKVAKAAAAVAAGQACALPALDEALPALDRHDVGRQSLDAMISALKMVRPRSHAAALQLASFTYLLRPCLPANWAEVAEAAALALPLGSLGTAPGAIEILEDGVEKAPTDQLQALSRIPAISAELVGKMPGLQDEKLVLECLAEPSTLLDSTFRPDEDEQDLRLTACLVLLAVSFLCQIRLGHASEEAVATLRAQPEWNDAKYADALGILSKLEAHDLLPLLRRRMTVPVVRAGMVMGQDLRDGDGVLLLSKGTQMSGRHVDRLRKMEPDAVGELEMLYDPEAA